MENENNEEIITEEAVSAVLATSEPIFDEPSGFDFFEMVDEEERMRYLCENELDSKKESSTYQLIYASKLEEGEQPLGRVIGHENQKKEINAKKWKIKKETKEKNYKK